MDIDTTTSNADLTNVGATSIGRTVNVTNRFFRPEAPNALLDFDVNGDLEEAAEELEMRQSQHQSLRQSKIDSLQKLKASEKAYQEFRTLSDKYMEADNARVPDAEQTAIIQSLETSVSSVVLTGESAAGTARQQTRNRMVKRLAELKDRQDADRKTWNNFCTEYEACSTALKAAKKRNGGDSQPIVDGRLIYAPFRGGSMSRSSRDIIIDIWSSICGPQMLDMNFNKLNHSVRELVKSLETEMSVYKPRKLTT